MGASAAGQDARVKSLVLWSAAANLASNFSNLLPLEVVGSRDTTVYPMPQQGQIFLNYHEGEEALVVLDGDHIFEVVR